MGPMGVGRTSEDPRVVRTKATVLAAAAQLLRDRGLAGFSIEALVAATGVSKTTIYRHWPSRRALLVSTIRAASAVGDAPDTGSLRGDLLAFIKARTDARAQNRWPESLLTLLDAAERDSEIRGVIQDIMAATASQLREILERAEHRGELAPAVDDNVAITLILGSLMFERLVSRRPPSTRNATAIIDTLLAGIERA